jgi:hypothetical protein
MSRVALTGLRLPIDWARLGLDAPWRGRSTTVAQGAIAWSWSVALPDLGIAGFVPDDRPRSHQGWDVDHVVLLVPDLEAAVTELRAAGAALRLRLDVRGRETAFFRMGTVLEVIGTEVPAPRLYGTALVTEQPLEDLAATWRDAGLDVSDPRDAIQPGRRILTVRDAGAGLAVMSPEVAIDEG